MHSPRAIGARGLTYNAWAAAVNVAQWIAGLSNRYCIDRVALDHGEMPVSVQFSYGAPPVFAFTIVRLTATDVQGVGEVLVPPNRFLEASKVGIRKSGSVKSSNIVNQLPEPKGNGNRNKPGTGCE